MKELSIEEKAKAYEEKLDVARHIYADPSVKDEDKYYIEVIFPELAESENERIRKEIIALFKGQIHSTSAEDNKKFVAWLENQGEQKPVDKIQLGKKYKCIASPRYSTFMMGEIYKPEDKYLCSLMNFCSDCFEPIEDEQKPAIEMKSAEESLGIDSDTYNKIVDECVYELEEQKPAWSEDDEKLVKNLISTLSNLYARNLIEKETKEKYTNLLKSIRPQSQWKPSEGQMEALKGVQEGVFRLGILESLYNDLLKLKQ